jgi:hypothetical protein
MSKKWTVVPLDTQATGLLCKAFAFWRFFGKILVVFWAPLHAALMASETIDISIFRIYDTRYREQAAHAAGSVREGLWGLLIMRKVVLASALK